jgi:hypothetical protein
MLAQCLQSESREFLAKNYGCGSIRPGMSEPPNLSSFKAHREDRNEGEFYGEA